MAQTLTLEKIKAIKEGLSHYFPFEAGETSNSIFRNDTWSDLDGIYKWKGRDDYFTTLSEATGIQNLKEIKKATFILDGLEKNFSNTIPNDQGKEAPRPEGQTSTIITKRTHEGAFIDAEQRQKSDVEARKKAKSDIDTGIKKQQELYNEAQKLKQKIEEINKPEIVEELKGKKLYAKVEAKDEDKIKLTEDQELQIKMRSEEAQEKPSSTIEKLTKEITANPNVINSLKEQGFNDEEIQRYSKHAATTVVEELSQINTPEYVPISYKTAILAKVATSAEVVGTSGLTKNAKDIVQASANNIAVFRIQPEVITRNILNIVLGKDATNVVLGVSSERLNVSLSAKRQSGYSSEVDLQRTLQSNTKLMMDQADILEKLSDLGGDKIRGSVSDRAYFAIQQRIASLPEKSVLRKVVTSRQAELLFFSKFTQGGVPNLISPGNVIGRLALEINPSYAPLITSLAGGSYGAITAAATTATYTSIQITGGVMAAEAFAGGAAGAAAGSVVPVVGTIIGAVVGFVGGEVINKAVSKLKVWWTENKDKAGPAIAIGLGFGGLILGGPGAGGIAFGLGLAVTGSLGVFAAGAFGVLGFIGRSIGIAIATPVIVTLLVLPPLVAFIMLVINNSAYVVPPNPLSPSSGTVGTNIKIECTEEKGPVGVDGPNSTSPIANRAWEIAYDLYQGFWCYWNRPPPAPSPYDKVFPNDTIKYPPDYSSSFDYEYYFRDPNPQTWTTLQLFWCTYLVIRSYQSTNNSIKFDGADTNTEFMMNHFKQLGRFISAEDATPDNIPPGSAIFFHVASGHEGANHVGVVYSVNRGGMVYVESNNAVKSQSVFFKYNGTSSCTPLCLKNATPEECGCYNTTNGIGNIGSGSGEMITLGFGLP